MVDVARARAPHEGRRFANSAVNIEAVPPATRIALRAGGNVAGKIIRPLGLKLPLSPGSSVSKGGRSALWLGPDEWLIVDDNPDVVSDLMAKLGKVDCSAVDVSQRNTAIMVSGAGAKEVLSSGCLLDLALPSFSVGSCSRTIFGKIEIVIWRLDKTSFRVEVWRSFSDYLWSYLLDAAQNICIEQA